MEVVFPITTAPGLQPTESGGRLINSTVEYAPPGSRSKHIWRAVPGLVPATTIGTDDHRGALKLGSTLIVINDDEGYSLDSSYSSTTLSGDAVPGEGRVIMARNMRATPQIIVVTDNGMVKIEGGAIATFTDADLPAPNSVCFKDGYFFFGIGDGRCFASGLNDVTVSSLDWTRAESSPDGLTRVFPFASGIALGGENSIELFSNTGNPTGFPFTRSTVLPYGLYGLHAVTGFIEGFTGDPLFVDNEGVVRLMSGFGARAVSTKDVEDLINAISDRTTLTADCYVSRGQPVYVLSCADWTLEYSPASATSPEHWRERVSIGSARWRAGIVVNCFNRWLALDETGDEILQLDAAFRREGTQQMVWQLRSTQAHNFPARAQVHRASFDFLVGVGTDTGIDPIETNPQVQISWSDDGGVTWSNPVFRSLGTQGEYRAIDVNRLGITKRQGRQYKLVVADPVPVAFYGGAQDVEALAA
ncbi:MAG: hypothetical protein K0R44_1427 [Thermomicrobiales bacterium]|jgi:hypothetical protein|nr:hypothetical protein [Thermomicrobiales bacterium]